MSAIRVDEGRKNLILKLISFLDHEGIDAGHAMRFVKAGEFGLSFQEIFFAAKSNERAFLRLLEPLKELNMFFAQDQYLAKHCGFPLDFPAFHRPPES